jgi:hypothetical protein
MTAHATEHSGTVLTRKDRMDRFIEVLKFDPDVAYQLAKHHVLGCHVPDEEAAE